MLLIVVPGFIRNLLSFASGMVPLFATAFANLGVGLVFTSSLRLLSSLLMDVIQSSRYRKVTIKVRILGRATDVMILIAESEFIVGVRCRHADTGGGHFEIPFAQLISLRRLRQQGDSRDVIVPLERRARQMAGEALA